MRRATAGIALARRVELADRAATIGGCRFRVNPMLRPLSDLTAIETNRNRIAPGRSPSAGPVLIHESETDRQVRTDQSQHSAFLTVSNTRNSRRSFAVRGHPRRRFPVVAVRTQAQIDLSTPARSGTPARSSRYLRSLETAKPDSPKSPIITLARIRPDRPEKNI